MGSLVQIREFPEIPWPLYFTNARSRKEAGEEIPREVMDGQIYGPDQQRAIRGLDTDEAYLVAWTKGYFDGRISGVTWFRKKEKKT